MAEFRPYQRLCDFEYAIPWIQQFRELHGGMDPPTLQCLLHQQEILTVAQPVVLKDPNGHFTIYPARLSERRTFVVRPQNVQLGCRQQVGYHTPMS